MKKYVAFALISSIFTLCSCQQKPESHTQDQQRPAEKKEQTIHPDREKSETSTHAKKPESKAETAEPFGYLSKVEVDKAADIYIKYNSENTEVYNKKVKELPESDPFFPEGGPSMNNIKMLKTKIEPSGKNYYVVFSYGPSADPSFMFYQQGNFEQPAFTISALQVFIPGNGSLYSSGHTNNLFNTRKKYQVHNNTLKEIEQPFYYVGLETQTSAPVKLYASEQLNDVIANLPADYDMEVLINKKGTNLFLVKTKFGLTGWVKAEMCGLRTQIDGLDYAGD
jgi:hypothetical protein